MTYLAWNTLGLEWQPDALKILSITAFAMRRQSSPCAPHVTTFHQLLQDHILHKHTVPVSQQLPKGRGLTGRQHLTFSKLDHLGLLSMHICRDGLLSDPSPRGVERVDGKLLIHWHWGVKAPLARGFGSFGPQDEYEDTEETSLRMSCHSDARSKAAVLTSPSTATPVTPGAPRAACDAAVCYICTWPQVFCHLHSHPAFQLPGEVKVIHWILPGGQPLKQLARATQAVNISISPTSHRPPGEFFFFPPTPTFHLPPPSANRPSPPPLNHSFSVILLWPSRLNSSINMSEPWNQERIRWRGANVSSSNPIQHLIFRIRSPRRTQGRVKRLSRHIPYTCCGSSRALVARLGRHYRLGQSHSLAVERQPSVGWPVLGQEPSLRLWKMSRTCGLKVEALGCLKDHPTPNYRPVSGRRGSNESKPGSHRSRWASYPWGAGRIRIREEILGPTAVHSAMDQINIRWVCLQASSCLYGGRGAFCSDSHRA